MSHVNNEPSAHVQKTKIVEPGLFQVAEPIESHFGRIRSDRVRLVNLVVAQEAFLVSAQVKNDLEEKAHDTHDGAQVHELGRVGSGQMRVVCGRVRVVESKEEIGDHVDE